MLDESTKLSIEILRAVLAGTTYDALAQQYGLTRTAIENRVKRLARILLRHIGIDGLSIQTIGYVHKLRSHHESVEKAIARYESAYPLPQPAPKTLTDRDVHQMLLRAGRHSQHGSRDAALVHTLLSTGLRPLEVARLEVRDYLDAAGEPRRTSIVRAEVSVNRKERPLFFECVAAREALDCYLQERVCATCQTSKALHAYRTLAPNDRLFLNDVGEGFRIEHVVHQSGERFLCRQILDTFRKIFKRIDIDGLSALSVRRTLALRLWLRGASEDQIGQILGINEKQSIRDLLPKPPQLAELMTEIYPGETSVASAKATDGVTGKAAQALQRSCGRSGTAC